MIDLQPFCGTSKSRPYLMKPFSMGDFSYATNAHIMVRVQKIEGVPPLDKNIDADRPLEGLEHASFAAPIFKLPPRPSADTACFDCDGRGHEHDCPQCGCTCHSCDGTGRQDAEYGFSTSYDGVPFALRYIRKMLALPGVEIAKPRTDIAPLLFRFEGGVGAVMPLRCKTYNHIEVFGA